CGCETHDETTSRPPRSRPETLPAPTPFKQKSSERVMSMLESRPRSDGWDPALWSIGTVLGIAIVYVACLV
ncbi:hypothetical protein ABTN67_20940, partial [Acinetobacter baumannii]